MKEKICCIFGAGEYFGTEEVPENAYIIAADAGVTGKRAEAIGVLFTTQRPGGRL